MTVDPAAVRGQLVVVPIANTTSFHRRSVYTSGLDDSNLNRVFPGDASGTPSEVLADWLFQNIIRPSQFYIDMHGGDMIEALVPFVLAPKCANRRTEEIALAMAMASGIPRVIHGEVHGSTVGAAIEAGIPAILAEVGGQGGGATNLWRSIWRVPSACSITSVCCRRKSRRPGRGNVCTKHLPGCERRSRDCFIPRLAFGDVVERGQPIGEITDYFGTLVQSLEAVADGEIVFLVTSLAMNVGDPLLAICV